MKKNELAPAAHGGAVQEWWVPAGQGKDRKSLALKSEGDFRSNKVPVPGAYRISFFKSREVDL
jgi:hypothetical protein